MLPLRHVIGCVVSLGVLVACGRAEPTTPPPVDPCDPAVSGRPRVDAVVGGERPVPLRSPAVDTPECPMPLVMLLHGYSVDGALQADYFGIDRLVEGKRVLVLAPDGRLDPSGRRYWNATGACCDFNRSGVDDVAYLRGLVAEVQALRAVDTKRIFVIGHSNGGFMAHRLACEGTGEWAAIASVAGAGPSAGEPCMPEAPVSVLQVHGTLDDVVLYDGGGPLYGDFETYPSAEHTVDAWATRLECAGPRQVEGVLDVVASVDGDEAQASAFAGCPEGLGVELWRVNGGGHIPTFASTFVSSLWRWLEAHPKR